MKKIGFYAYDTVNVIFITFGNPNRAFRRGGASAVVTT